MPHFDHLVRNIVCAVYNSGIRTWWKIHSKKSDHMQFALLSTHKCMAHHHYGLEALAVHINKITKKHNWTQNTFIDEIF